MPRSQSSSNDLVLHRAQQHFLCLMTRVLGDDCSIKWASVAALVHGRLLSGGVEELVAIPVRLNPPIDISRCLCPPKVG